MMILQLRDGVLLFNVSFESVNSRVFADTRECRPSIILSFFYGIRLSSWLSVLISGEKSDYELVTLRGIIQSCVSLLLIFSILSMIEILLACDTSFSIRS